LGEIGWGEGLVVGSEVGLEIGFNVGCEDGCAFERSVRCRVGGFVIFLLCPAEGWVVG
jgi:hypothetical protein